MAMTIHEAWPVLGEEQMRISSRWLRRQIAGGLVLLLAAPLAEAAGVLPREPVWGQQAQSVSAIQTQSQDPGSQTQGGQSGTSQSSSAQTQTEAPKPVGTAAAPLEKTTGVAASRPAGAVIAPAKQRRTRSILIKVGVLLAAGVALGTVVGLSGASPSRSH